MSVDNIEYFRERATIERGLAMAATEPRVIAVHEALARGYEALLRGEMESASDRMAPDQEQRSATA